MQSVVGQSGKIVISKEQAIKKEYILHQVLRILLQLQKLQNLKRRKNRTLSPSKKKKKTIFW
jgi:hypothetical protein